MAPTIAKHSLHTQTKCYFEAPVSASIPSIQAEWSQAERAQRAALGRVQREKFMRLLGAATCPVEA